MPIVRRENIEKKSTLYDITNFFVDIFYKLYFPIKTIGMEKINFKDILIFAPNHQNALMDALALLAMRWWQPVFLARADIFSKPFLVKILTFLRIMPVYRIRDGFGNLKNNDQIFRKTMDVLNNRNGLVILPEGNHEGFRRLRPLKKGVARIAFQAMNESDNKMDIKIVPVGIEYSHYYKFNSKILIHLGEPINLSDYYPKYLENNAIAINKLTAELALRIKKEMIHIENEEYYNEYEIVRKQGAFDITLINKQKHSMENLFNAGRSIVATLDEMQLNNNDEFMRIMEVARDFEKNLQLARIETPVKKLNILNLSLKKLALLATLPIFLYGFINNLLPLGIVMIVSSKIKDPQFISSFRYVLSFVLFPLFFIIQTVIFAFIVKNGLWTLLYFISLPIMALLMMKWRKFFFGLMQQWKLLKIKLFQKTLYQQIQNNIQTIRKLVMIN